MSERRKRGSSSRGTGDSIASPPTRRSGRNSLNKSTDSPKPAPVMKLAITAKKIMPRKTLAALASAESQPKNTSTTQPTTTTTTPRSTPKVSSAVKPALRRSTRVSPSSEKENVVLDKSQDVLNAATDASLTSKIDVLSPIPVNVPQSPSYDDRAKVMSQKVRRSYSRLEMSMCGGSFLYSPTRDTDSDTSTPNPAPKAGRRSLFGFDKLLSSESQEEEAEKKRVEEESKQTNNESASGKSISMSMEEPDPNIPGIALAKQKRRKRKIPQIEKSDLDEWAAAMNAQFEEAEKFDLTVE